MASRALLDLDRGLFGAKKGCNIILGMRDFYIALHKLFRRCPGGRRSWVNAVDSQV